MDNTFVHLHVHTEYSLLDGASNIADLVGYAKELVMPALAITDHGVMYGAIEFYKACEREGIKPIIGCEVYVAPRSRFDKDKFLDKERYHLILLAESLEGYHNLMKIVSVGALEGFYTKPRIDMETLSKYSQGIICLSACIQGEVPQHILKGELDTAEESLKKYLAIFGKEHYFIEIQNHDLEEERLANKELVRLAHKYEIGLVATNDLHYVRRADAAGHDILLCLQTQTNYNDTKRMRFNNDMYYLKSREEMQERFPDYPEALDNSLRIAERCSVKLEFGHLLLPEFPLPEGVTEMGYLRKLCEEGFKTRYKADDTVALQRLEYELGVIGQMGYPGYFLIVWDFINYCRQNDIPVGPGRGSAAGSIVAYLTGITNIDPIKYNLIFERFLNPERVSMPDIDTDICYVKRHLVVEYLSRKYGESHVAQIITFGTLAAKAAIKDVGRVLDIPLSTVNKINKMIPNTPGTTLTAALSGSRELRESCEADLEVRRMVEFAEKVEGKPRHSSTHAAGVVITPKELTDYVPLQITSSSDDNQTYVCTQYDKDMAESLGLLKMDLLGLRTLTVIDDTVKMLHKNRGIKLDVDSIPMDDRETCAMLSKGATDGVFQMESDGMTRLMVKLAPENMADLIPLVALYRPGPLGSGMADDFINGRHGKQTAKVLHPLMNPILADTYGVILYQEQVMQITSVLGGFSLGEADILRRAMGKKKAKELDSMKERFIVGAGKVNNIKPQLAEEIFALLQHFSGYGFNKSHSAAYAYVAYQTAYLKAHYPAEYMAAFLNSVIGTGEKVHWYISVCRNKMGLKVLPPDINASVGGFSVDGNNIRFGLSGIKNVGDNAVENIVWEREHNGAFKDFSDFTQRIDLSKINKKVVENLILCGAMDSFGAKRAQLLAVMDGALELAGSRQKDRISGQIGLFNDQEFVGVNSVELPQMEEIPKRELLAKEREIIGFYVTGHPLDDYAKALRRLKEIGTLNEQNYSDGSRVTVGGIIAESAIKTTKRGDAMARFVLEDLSGRINVLAFPRSYVASAKHIYPDNVVQVTGIIKLDEDQPQIFANTVLPLEEIASDVHLYILAEKNNAATQKALAEVFNRYRGNSPLYLHLLNDKKIIRVDKKFWVQGENEKFREEIRTVLGENALGK